MRGKSCAYGLSEREFTPVYANGAAAAKRMRAATIDAMFFVSGVPAGFISALAASIDIALLPIDAAALQALHIENQFYVPGSFAADVYRGTTAINTVAFGAQRVTSSDAEPELVYRLVKRLFSPAVLAQVKASHPNAAMLSANLDLPAGSMPLHLGAGKFYREIGVLK